jgi:hypothetical protein
MKKYWLGIIATVLMTSALRAENTLFPSCTIGGSIAPYVDKDGYVNPIVPLGNVDFGDGLTLPLALNFSSKVRPPSPEFGQGWECPLFESKIFDVQKDLKKVELMGGRQIYLVYNERTDTWRHYFSDSWKGEAKGDEFDLTYDTGVKFAFDKGLISSMTMPNGRTILWNRSGDKLISLSETGKSPALQLVYDNLGFAKQMLFNPDSLGVAKKVYDFSASLVYAGIDKINCPGGRIIALDRSHDKSLNPILSWTDKLHPPITLSWDRNTGKITSDDKYTYQIAEVSTDNTWPKMLRKNKLTGKSESYYFDENRGIKDETLADGTIQHEETIMSPGPTYRVVRLIQETKNGKTHNLLRRSFDDEGHLLLEATGLANGKEQVKQYVYDDAGRVVSYLFNGKEMWKNIYDSATGQLMERDLPNLNVKMAFDQLPGGEVKESIEKAGGVVASTKTLDSSAWQKTVQSMQRID